MHIYTATVRGRIRAKAYTIRVTENTATAKVSYIFLLKITLKANAAAIRSIIATNDQISKHGDYNIYQMPATVHLMPALRYRSQIRLAKRVVLGYKSRYG